MRRHLHKLAFLAVPIGLGAGPLAAAESCDEGVARLQERIDQADVEQHQRDRIGEMIESARLFQDLEREQACVRIVEEAMRIVDSFEQDSGIEERAAEKLGRAATADESNPLADVPSFRLIGRMVLDAEGARVGEVVDVTAVEEGERLAVLRVGEPLDEDKKTVAVPMSKFDPDERERLHLIDMTETDLRELPAYDPLSRGEPAATN